jgi:hypothetical protein
MRLEGRKIRIERQIVPINTGGNYRLLLQQIAI